jgi:radical SAM superfamily enzyme YgiQ (UPF0313 family)
MYFRMLPTMGLPILTRIFNEAGHYAETVDLEALQIHPYRFMERMAEQRSAWPDVIGFTGLHQAARGIRECIEAIKEVGFSGKIVIGGIFATTQPELALSFGADLVVVGECEGNVVQLFESGATGIQQGEPLPIEDIPTPDWGHFYPPIASYYGNMAMLRPNPGISMWTRGCPYKCIFCSNNIFYHQATRYRPPVKIQAEMEELKRRGCQNLYVYDDEMVGTKIPPGWMKDIADRIEYLDLKWVTQGRCSRRHITLDLLKDARRAGCRTIFWGIESFSPKVLRAIKKVLEPADVWHTLRLAKEAGIENGIFTMVGNYQETAEDVEISLTELEKAYKEGLVDYRQTTVCTVMPGTELEQIQKHEGWYIEPENTGRDLQKPIGTPWLSAQQIEHYQKRFAEVCPVWIPS